MIVEIAPFSDVALQFLSRMAFQASSIREAPLTLTALESLLSGVTPCVILIGFTEWEKPSAPDAFERFHSRVILPVHLKATHFMESLSALSTHKAVLFGANPCVSVKGLFTSETLPALIAGERLLSGVLAHVILKADFVCEELPALFAGERARASVAYHVGVESSFICEALSALSASVRLLSGVKSHVDFEVSFLNEAIPALLTCKMVFS